MDFETVRNLLTCGICGKLCREVTAIDECCHIFCWRCIFKKIEREKCRNCPKCNADLGGAPLQRIKTDYKWQSVRDNFNHLRHKLIDLGLMKPRAKDLARASNEDRNDAEPSEQMGNRKEHEEATPEEVAQDTEEGDRELEALSQAPELARRDIKGTEKVVIELDNEDNENGYSSFPLTLPIKKRKLFITAIVDDTEAENPTAVPVTKRGRRKAMVRKVTRPLPRRSSSSSDLEETDSDDDYTLGSESRRRMSRVVKIKDRKPNALEDGTNETPKLVDHTVEGASKSKPENFRVVVKDCELNLNGRTNIGTSSGPKKRKRGRPRKEEKLVSSDLPEQNPNIDDPAEKRVFPEDPIVSDPTEKTILLEDLNIPTHLVIDRETVHQRTLPIWFQLLPSSTQDNRDALPSLSRSFIVLKNVNFLASYIKKYLALKLDLASEDELEIRMRGALVHPDTPIHLLKKLWVQTATESESQQRAAVGSSGEEYIMVLKYGRSTGRGDQL